MRSEKPRLTTHDDHPLSFIAVTLRPALMVGINTAQ